MMDREIAGCLRVRDSEIRALVSLLSEHEQIEWLRIHEAYCAKIKIDPINGRPVSEQSCDVWRSLKAAEAADKS